MTKPETFRDKYGPWAMVAGASEGVGAAMAQAFATRGVHVVLLARRQRVLDEVAESIRTTTGVEARAVAVDLAEDDAMDRILDATADLEMGLVAYNAGADPNYEPFLEQPVDASMALVQRNCVVPMQLCHHFAGPMVARGRGGLVLVGSGAGLVGAPNIVAYAATKAFDMVLGESLWAELHPHGVDVLNLVLAVTDTPALRRVLARRGVLSSPEDSSPIPGAVSGGIVGVLLVFGVDADIAIVSVLGYRSVAIWLPAPIGLVALAGLKRTIATWARAEELPPVAVAEPASARPPRCAALAQPVAA